MASVMRAIFNVVRHNKYVKIKEKVKEKVRYEDSDSTDVSDSEITIKPKFAIKVENKHRVCQKHNPIHEKSVTTTFEKEYYSEPIPLDPTILWLAKGSFMKIDWYTDIKEVTLPKFDSILIFRKVSASTHKILYGANYECLEKLKLVKKSTRKNVTILSPFRLKHTADCFAILIKTCGNRNKYIKVNYTRQSCSKMTCVINTCDKKLFSTTITHAEYPIYKIEDSKGKDVPFTVHNDIKIFGYNYIHNYSSVNQILNISIYRPTKIKQFCFYDFVKKPSNNKYQEYYLFGKYTIQLSEKNTYDIIVDDPQKFFNDYWIFKDFLQLRRSNVVINNIASVIDFTDSRHGDYYNYLCYLQSEYEQKKDRLHPRKIHKIYKSGCIDVNIITNYDRCYIVNNHRKFFHERLCWLKSDNRYNLYHSKLSHLTENESDERWYYSIDDIELDGRYMKPVMTNPIVTKSSTSVTYKNQLFNFSNIPHKNPVKSKFMKFIGKFKKKMPDADQYSTKYNPYEVVITDSLKDDKPLAKDKIKSLSYYNSYLKSAKGKYEFLNNGLVNINTNYRSFYRHNYLVFENDKYATSRNFKIYGMKMVIYKHRVFHTASIPTKNEIKYFKTNNLDFDKNTFIVVCGNGCSSANIIRQTDNTTTVIKDGSTGHTTYVNDDGGVKETKSDEEEQLIPAVKVVGRNRELNCVYGWKMCILKDKSKFVLVKLRIPSDAQIYGNRTGKLRANKAHIIGMWLQDGTFISPFEEEPEVVSIHDHKFRYSYMSPDIVPDSFTENNTECANGIHFFLDYKAVYKYMTESTFGTFYGHNVKDLNAPCIEPSFDLSL